MLSLDRASLDYLTVLRVKLTSYLLTCLCTRVQLYRSIVSSLSYQKKSIARIARY
jgi:hypothetical protein